MSRSIVIGGGANGLATAITLAGLGHEVTLLEARSARVAEWSYCSTRGPFSHGLWLSWALKWSGRMPIQSRESVAMEPSPSRRKIRPCRTGLRKWIRSAMPFRHSTQARSGHSAGGVHSLRVPDLDVCPEAWAKPWIELASGGSIVCGDWLDESGIARSTQAALILPALRGSWMRPRSPSSALAVLFHHALSGARVKGGMSALLNALQNRAKQLGVQVQTEAEVASIRIEDRAVRGGLGRWLQPGRRPCRSALSAHGEPSWIWFRPTT